MPHPTPPITSPNPVEAVHHWFALMGRYCAAVDYDAAERIFAEDVVSFGTTMDIVTGRRALREGQWESIWGNITDFKMDSGQRECRWERRSGVGSGHLDVHRLRPRPQVLPPSGTGDGHARTARRGLARHAYPLLTVSRRSAAHLRRDGVNGRDCSDPPSRFPASLLGIDSFNAPRAYA